MRCGAITVDLNRGPVEVGILVEGQQQSGVFIVNRARRGIRIDDELHEIDVTADEALLLLAWLQEQEEALRAMLNQEATALAAIEQRDSGVPPQSSQVEGDRAPSRNVCERKKCRSTAKG
jgi:hypothetical protein